jgi:hypothetical protein
MRLRLLVAVVVAALSSFAAVVFAAGGVDRPRGAPAVAAAEVGERDTAVPFVRSVVRLIAQNRYAAAWPLLHPSHRRAAGRSEYVTCEKHSPIPGRVVSVQAGSEFGTAVTLAPGTRVPSRAVRVRVVLLDLATREQTTVRDVVHAVRVAGRWTWVLPPDRFARYRAGACPDAPPPIPGAST